MLSVREEPDVQLAVDDACERWERARDAWDVITWVLARDPTCGDPMVEGGQARTFVYQGSWAHDMPTIVVLYVIEPPYITIRAVRFSDPATAAGNA